MAVFAVLYTYTQVTVAGRDEHRPAHRAWLRSQVDSGNLLSSGAYPDGTGALIIAVADDLPAAQQLMSADPFLKAGVVDSVQIVEWKPTMGVFAGSLTHRRAE
jgi:uncharacterized protein